MGGRLKLSTVGLASGSSRDRDLRLLLVGALVAAAAIHAAVVPEHLSEWPAAGMFFILLAIWQVAVAGLLLARLEERTLLLAAAAVSLGPLTLWLLSRTAGLSVGSQPGTAEAIGLPDLAACALEIVALLAALALLRRPGRRNNQPSPSTPAAWSCSPWSRSP